MDGRMVPLLLFKRQNNVRPTFVLTIHRSSLGMVIEQRLRNSKFAANQSEIICSARVRERDNGEPPESCASNGRKREIGKCAGRHDTKSTVDGGYNESSFTVSTAVNVQ